MSTRGSSWRRLALWTAPLWMLAAVVAGLLVALDPPSGLPELVLGLGGIVMVAWIAISVLWPARADRSCPACRQDALVRLDPDDAVGVRCTACGFRDETQSAWILAEEEGPLEGIVLEERKRGRKRVRPPRSGEVDSARESH